MPKAKGAPKRKRKPFSDALLRALKPRRASAYTRSDWAPKNSGRLLIEVEPDGTKRFYFRYRVSGADRLIVLGAFDPTGRAGLTLASARVKADEQRAIMREHGDPKAHKAKVARKADDDAKRGTLGDLCKGYVEHLRVQGKTSARSVECALELHVKEAMPKLWLAPAVDMTSEDVADVLAKIVKAKHTRTYNKMRSYLHAAFKWGASSALDPRHKAAEGKRFALASNPVSLVPRVGEWDAARDRALSDDELAHYLRAVDAIADVQGGALRFLLVLGCQRIVQVLRAPWSAYDFEARTLLLRDPKGRGAARDHLLPLSPAALAILAPYQSINRDAPGPFSGDGERSVHAATLTKLVTEISGTLHTKHRVARFTLRDLRRTAETAMQRLGIARDVRAHLLSHGRASGVQGRHYERHDYLPEKVAALATWEAHLRGLREDRPKRTAKVVAIGSRRA